MKKLTLLFLPLSILALACGFVWPLSPATQTATPTFTASATASSTARPVENTILATVSLSAEHVLVRYENIRYGYGISYPSTFVLNVRSDDYVELGDKITISVSDVDPESRAGDGPVVESVSAEVVGLNQARVLHGYIGSVGGYIPQQFISYVILHNGLYYVFTQYALGLHATEGDVSQIVLFVPNDEAVFRYMVASVAFR